MNITPKNIIRIFCILYIGFLLLPIVFANIFWPFKSTWFYIYGWIALLLLFEPRVLISKPLLYMYLMYLVFTLLIMGGGIEEDFVRVYSIFTYIFIATSMLQYFFTVKDFKGLKIIVQFALFSIFITMISSAIGLHQFPMAARNTAGILQRDGQFELVDFFKKRGIASYDFFYGLAYIVPILVSFLKLKLKKNAFKWIFLASIILAILSIVQSQFTTPALLAILGFVMSYWSPTSIKKTFLVYGMLVFMFFILLIPIIKFFYLMSTLVPGVTISSRLYDVGGLLQGGYENSSMEVVTRVSRIPLQIENFIASPIYGGYETTGHVFWFDILAEFGLLGIIPWMLLLKDHITRNLKYMASSDWKFYFISMFLFFLTGVFRNIGGSTMSMLVFFVLPAFIVVKYQLIEDK